MQTSRPHPPKDQNYRHHDYDKCKAALPVGTPCGVLQLNVQHQRGHLPYVLVLRPILQANAIRRRWQLDFELLRVLLDCPLFSPLLSLPLTMVHGDDIELKLTRPRRNQRLSERRTIVPFNASSAYFYSSICSQMNTSI